MSLPLCLCSGTLNTSQLLPLYLTHVSCRHISSNSTRVISAVCTPLTNPPLHCYLSTPRGHCFSSSLSICRMAGSGLALHMGSAGILCERFCCDPGSPAGSTVGEGGTHLYRKLSTVFKEPQILVYSLVSSILLFRSTRAEEMVPKG